MFINTHSIFGTPIIPAEQAERIEQMAREANDGRARASAGSQLRGIRKRFQRLTVALVHWLRRRRRTIDFAIFGIAVLNLLIFSGQLLRVSL